VLITGATGSGKSRLLQTLVRRVHGPCSQTPHSSTEVDWWQLLPSWDETKAVVSQFGDEEGEGLKWLSSVGNSLFVCLFNLTGL